MFEIKVCDVSRYLKICANTIWLCFIQVRSARNISTQERVAQHDGEREIRPHLNQIVMIFLLKKPLAHLSYNKKPERPLFNLEQRPVIRR